MSVELGNIWYWGWLFLYGPVAVVAHFLLRNKSKSVQLSTIYGLILTNLVIHFVSPFLVWDQRSNPIVRLFMINLCAVWVLLGPGLFFIKDRFLKPGFVYSIIMAGFLVSFYPGEAIGLPAFSFSVIRFYFQHLLLFLTGVLFISLGHLKLSLREIWTLPVVSFVALLLVVANMAILDEWGLIGDMRNWNMAFQWGPGSLEQLVGWLIPPFLRTYTGGVPGFIPVFWQIPLFLTIYPLFAIMVNLLTFVIKKHFGKGID